MNLITENLKIVPGSDVKVSGLTAIKHHRQSQFLKTRIIRTSNNGRLKGGKKETN